MYMYSILFITICQIKITRKPKIAFTPRKNTKPKIAFTERKKHKTQNSIHTKKKHENKKYSIHTKKKTRSPKQHSHKEKNIEQLIYCFYIDIPNKLYIAFVTQGTLQKGIKSSHTCWFKYVHVFTIFTSIVKFTLKKTNYIYSQTSIKQSPVFKGHLSYMVIFFFVPKMTS